MTEYIDRNEIPAPYYAEEYDEYVVGIGEINSIPTADVQEVKHGKWVISKEEFKWDGDNCPIEVYCNSCRGVISYLDSELYFYCPYCGAKMDKE